MSLIWRLWSGELWRRCGPASLPECLERRRLEGRHFSSMLSSPHKGLEVQNRLSRCGVRSWWRWRASRTWACRLRWCWSAVASANTYDGTCQRCGEWCALRLVSLYNFHDCGDCRIGYVPLTPNQLSSNITNLFCNNIRTSKLQKRDLD